MRHIIATLMLFTSCAAHAQDILILGEVHDNPAHHAVQAEKVEALRPAAIVFEMLTPEQADGEVLEQVTDTAALEAKLAWAESGWPDFAMYHPIFVAGSNARIYGAGLPREAAMQAMQTTISEIFGVAAPVYGLDQPLSADEQETREELQFAAHCDALPREMLPAMVEVQRLRDGMLARAARRAFDETGGPVAVITGNGHARRDWGVPAYLERVAPELEVKVIGQTEEGRPLEGGFDLVLSAPTVDRPDPCDAFR